MLGNDQAPGGAGTATFAPGDTVVRRDTGVVGVVIDASRWPTIRVAFGSQKLLLHAEDLVRDAGAPDEQLAQGQLGEPQAHALRLRALYLTHAHRYDPLASLNNSRIEPQPHQVFIAHRVTRKLRPRMLLADEVGLGKTIEAGLIIKELTAREQAERVLVVAPASLCQQWQTELRTKFNDDFQIIDGDIAKSLERRAENPFRAYDRVICSLPFATRPTRRDQVIEAGWDVVIFDEAHRVRRTRQRSTLAYELADELKEQSEGLLLLTATPMQLDPLEFYYLAQLVEPGLFRSEQEFKDTHCWLTPQLNALMRALDSWAGLTDSEQARTRVKHADLLASINPEALDLDDPFVRDSLMNHLAARHPLGDVMVRNRKAELGLQGRRIAKRHAIQPSEEERDVHERVVEYLRTAYNAAAAKKNTALGFVLVSYQKMLTSSSHALKTSLRKRVAGLRSQPVMKRPKDVAIEDDPAELSVALESVEGQTGLALAAEIETLDDLIVRLGKVRDSKGAALVRLLGEIRTDFPGEKVVLFTQFVETQRFVTRVLTDQGFKVEKFNGRLSPDEKESAIRRFRDGADVLVSTEAGGEGRNLQFANHIVNYDLPWNPMKVEQRIGRLDRIGQTRPVYIHNLFYADTLEERIVDVLGDRIHLFEQSIGSLDPILGELEKAIERLAFQGEREDFVSFGEDVEAKVKQARLAEERFADFAMDRASLRRDVVNDLLERRPMATQPDLEQFCRDALDYLGGQLFDDEDGESAVSLAPRVASRLGFRHTSTRGTFNPRLAIRRDELQFFAIGHDFVDRLVARMAELPEAATGARHDSRFPPGLWVELVWRITAEVGVQEGVLVRHVVGPDLDVRSEELTAPPGGRPTRTSELPTWVPDAVEASRRRFDADLHDRRRVLADRLAEITQGRLQQAERLYDYKRERLLLAVKAAEEWLAERASADRVNAKDAKILPARRGKLAKDLERLGRLREEYEVECDRIKSQESAPHAEVLWASLVVGS